MYDFELKVEFVANYKGSNEDMLFISCGNGTGGKYKVTSLDEIKEKVVDYIDNCGE